MVQYLINLTAIWFISLTCFDVLLKKESYHQYNRAYLLVTFLLGLLLPLWQWGSDSIIYHTPALASYSGVAASSAQIVTTVIPVQHQSTNWLFIIYCAGIAITTGILLIDIIKLTTLYHSAKRYKYNNINIIETGKGHAPFSLFNNIFITGRDKYSDNEWNMLVHHEWQHYKKLHFADLFIMQLARIVFWFHPLVYLYYTRLMMIHEYQSDSYYNTEPQVYGKFLVEQSLLNNAPQITHSFNRSPIKNRIIMLTKKSNRYGSLKLLVIAPLTLGCMLCFTKTGYSFKDDKDVTTNKITYRGNVFEFGFENGSKTNKKVNTTALVKGENTADTLIARPQPVSFQISNYDNAKKTGTVKSAKGEAVTITSFAAPLKMNGKKIYSGSEADVTPPEFTGNDGDISQYLFNNTTEYLSKLNDGKYWVRLMYPVIDEKGKIVYYENKGIVTADDKIVLDVAVKQSIDEHFSKLMDDADVFTPAIFNGKAVPSYLAWGFEGSIIVKDHKATYVPPHYTEMK